MLFLCYTIFGLSDLNWNVISIIGDRSLVSNMSDSEQSDVTWEEFFGKLTDLFKLFCLQYALNKMTGLFNWCFKSNILY